MRDPPPDGACSERTRYPLRIGVGKVEQADSEYAYGGIHPSRLDARGVCHPVTARPATLTTNTTQLSWGKALGVLEARLTHATLEHGAKLRRWRMAVAEVHSDFVMKLPGAETPILTVRASQLDGRTEGSRYPNFMLPWAQQRYDL